MSPARAGRAAIPAAIYLADAEDAQAGRHPVAGLPVAFRVLMTALRAGCAPVAVPAVFRGTEVERAIERSPRARALTVWLGGAGRELERDPVILLPATAVLPPRALLPLLAARPAAVLAVAPAAAPVVLADGAVLAAARPPLGADLPAGDALARAVAAGGAGAVGGGWCIRAAGAAGRRAAEQRLYAESGSAIDTRLDRLVHRPLSRRLTRLAVALHVAPNPITLASLALGLLGVWQLAGGTAGSAAGGIALYFGATVLDHVDGEVARLTFAESRFGEWLDVVADTAVHAATGLALGVAAERAAGGGLGLGAIAAAGFALSAIAAKAAPGGGRVPGTLARLGNRDGFYLLLLAFLALLLVAPAALPALMLLAAVGSHAYWLGHLARRLRRLRPVPR